LTNRLRRRDYPLRPLSNFMNYFTDPSIADLLRIAPSLSGLKSLSISLAYALLLVLVPLEAIRQNLKAVHSAAGFGEMFVRLFVSAAGLILYDRIFNLIVGAAMTVEMAVLSERSWLELIRAMTHYFQTERLTVFSPLPLLFTWIVSFGALLAQHVLYWIRFALLALLYFSGPVFISRDRKRPPT